ncbi:unnamed protein product [Adineta steineri]|uniref:Uncharacterized protein n=1 Tax=Adineta steineri TaxID=433720 RepID=A0A815MR64_9BILA|nr:unnamed protein product [Adineta steineri]
MGLSGMIFCTCPDGQYTVNARCRLCDRPNICGAGYGAYCFEDPTTNPSGYTCFCPNNQFTVNKPCSDITTTLPVTTTTPPVTTTTPPVTTTTQATLPTVSDSFGRINGPIIITENMQVAERDQTAISGNGAAPELINSNDEQTPTGQSRSLCEQEGITVAGGQQGYQLHQLYLPEAICIDNNKTIFIADIMNERIVAWEYGSNNDFQNHRVMKWEKDAKEGVVVAGENNQGSELNQLSFPRGVIVDHLHQIFIVDSRNYRVMRWNEEDTQGSIVVGGHGQGMKANQLDEPHGLSLDLEGNIYVADSSNHRIQKYKPCIQ